MSFYINLVRNPLISVISNHLDGYPTPLNLSYLWGFGSLSGIALGAQILTGVFLARHYVPEIHIAFASVYKADVLVSWNFKHIVNFSKIHLINAVNLENNYSIIDIRSPMEVIEQWKKLLIV